MSVQHAIDDTGIQARSFLSELAQHGGDDAGVFLKKLPNGRFSLGELGARASLVSQQISHNGAILLQHCTTVKRNLQGFVLGTDDAIKALLEKTGWSHERLAAELGASLRTVKYWLSGKFEPQRALCEKLAWLSDGVDDELWRFFTRKAGIPVEVSPTARQRVISGVRESRVAGPGSLAEDADVVEAHEVRAARACGRIVQDIALLKKRAAQDDEFAVEMLARIAAELPEAALEAAGRRHKPAREGQIGACLTKIETALDALEKLAHAGSKDAEDELKRIIAVIGKAIESAAAKPRAPNKKNKSSA